MSTAKRILLLDTGNEWGGGTNSMFELLKRIDRSRFDVTCCFYKNYKKGQSGRLLSEELVDIGIPLILLPIRKQPLWAKLAKEIARGLLAWSGRLKRKAVFAIEMAWRIKPRAAELQKVLSDGKFDLLYVNNQPASNLEGYLAVESLNMPIVQHCRCTPTLNAEEISILNRSSTPIICVSQGVADVLKGYGLATQRLRVVHNAIDIQTPLSEPVSPGCVAGSIVIGTVGRLNELKSVDHLIKAIARLREEGLSVYCLVVGEGEERQNLEQLAASLGVSDVVRFAGFQAAPLGWVQAMDICVLCSSKEGFPRVVLEAMLAAKPVVGSDVNGTRELVVNEETGLLYAYGDIPELAASLRRLVQDPGLRREMGNAGRHRVAAHYSIEAYVAGVTKVLAETLQ
ncbi:MAG: glycosyltransferase [Azonexus sp.]